MTRDQRQMLQQTAVTANRVFTRSAWILRSLTK
jgi:hypothetical protein